MNSELSLSCENSLHENNSKSNEIYNKESRDFPRDCPRDCARDCVYISPDSDSFTQNNYFFLF